MFEGQEKLGGQLRYGIPGYRLPREVVDREIADILEAGDITVRTKTFVENAPALLNQGFDAVFAAFRAHYMLHALDTTRPYDGITEVLRELQQRGCRMAVVSNKMMAATQELVAHFFPEITVAIGEHEAEGIRKKPAPDTVFEALRQLNAPLTPDFSLTPTKAVYVGDSDVDVATAANSGLPCVSVLWGFRDRDFLKAHGATTFVAAPRELLSL